MSLMRFVDGLILLFFFNKVGCFHTSISKFQYRKKHVFYQKTKHWLEPLNPLEAIWEFLVDILTLGAQSSRTLVLWHTNLRLSFNFVPIGKTWDQKGTPHRLPSIVEKKWGFVSWCTEHSSIPGSLRNCDVCTKKPVLKMELLQMR